MERPLLRRRRQGLKREWTMAEAGDRDEASASEGEVIENDMKRLRLAQDYDGELLQLALAAHRDG